MYINCIGSWKIGQSGEVVDLASFGKNKIKNVALPWLPTQILTPSHPLWYGAVQEGRGRQFRKDIVPSSLPNTWIGLTLIVHSGVQEFVHKPATHKHAPLY